MDQKTTIDAFLGGRLMLEQPASGYRAGLDAILLAAACPLAADGQETILDCGAGVGAAGLSAAMRAPRARVVLVEHDAATVRLARANVLRNALADRVEVIEADLTAPLSASPELLALKAGFDRVIANPPYFEDGAGTHARDAHKQQSHSMTAGSLGHWLRFAASMTRDGGTVTLIHRTEALSDILIAFGPRFGAVRILPIQSAPGRAARRLLVMGVKGSRAPLTLLPPLIVHGSDGAKYSGAVEAILRDGAALAWPDEG